MAAPGRTDLPPTARQIAVLAAYVRAGSWSVAAHDAGISPNTARNHAAVLYRRLGVSSAWEAAVALGWLIPPKCETKSHAL